MTKEHLQTYLREKIPLGEFMQIAVDQIDSQGCILSCPLEPNRNDKDIAFGGSIATLGTLAAWGLVQSRFHGRPGNVLIRQGQTRYLKPGVSDLVAQAKSPTADQWEAMESDFDRRGIGKVSLTSSVTSGGIEIARFQGEFVFVAKK